MVYTVYKAKTFSFLLKLIPVLRSSLHCAFKTSWFAFFLTIQCTINIGNILSDKTKGVLKF